MKCYNAKVKHVIAVLAITLGFVGLALSLYVLTFPSRLNLIQSCWWGMASFFSVPFSLLAFVMAILSVWLGRDEKNVFMCGGIALLLASITFCLLPFVMATRSVDTEESICQKSLMQIEHAKGIHAVSNGLHKGDAVSLDEIRQYLNDTYRPCPKGGEHISNPVDIDPECTIGGGHTL